MTKPEAKRFSIINHYLYREMKYDPPVSMKPLLKEPQGYGSAEEVLMSQVSAMKALDYDWWLNTWDGDSQKKILERDKAAGRTKDYWTQQWKEKLRSAQVVLMRWILSGKYVLLAYQLVTPEGKEKKVEFPVAFRLAEGGWRATLDLEGDPVLLHYHEGKTRLERTIR